MSGVGAENPVPADARTVQSEPVRSSAENARTEERSVVAVLVDARARSQRQPFSSDEFILGEEGRARHTSS